MAVSTGERTHKREQSQCHIQTACRQPAAVALTFVKVSYDGSPFLGGLIMMPVASCPIVLEHRDRDDSLYSSARTCVATTGGKRKQKKKKRAIRKQIIVHDICLNNILGKSWQQTTGFINSHALLHKRVLFPHSSNDTEDQCGLKSNVGPSCPMSNGWLFRPEAAGKKAGLHIKEPSIVPRTKRCNLRKHFACRAKKTSPKANREVHRYWPRCGND